MSMQEKTKINEEIEEIKSDEEIKATKSDEEVEKIKSDETLATSKNENISSEIKEDKIITMKASEFKEISDKVVNITDKYLRTLADLENVKKRALKSQEDISKYAVTNFAKDLLPVIDVFQKAFAEINEEKIEDASIKNFILGIKLTKQELEKTLTKFGITKINAVGQKFDPNYHEALFANQDETKEDNTIIELIEEGYTISDRLLRSAKVGIIKNKK